MKDKKILENNIREIKNLNKEDLEKVCGGIHIGIKVPIALPLRPNCSIEESEILNK